MLPCFVKNYSYWRIKHIMTEDYGLELKKLPIYKGARYGQPARYDLVDIETGETVLEYVTLYGLRAMLTSEGYPEQEDSDNN